MKYESYIYEKGAKKVFEHLPEINGRNCVAVHSCDLQQQRDEAYALLVTIANGEIDLPKMGSGLLKFLTDKGQFYPTCRAFLIKTSSASNTEGNPSPPCEEPH